MGKFSDFKKLYVDSYIVFRHTIITKAKLKLFTRVEKYGNYFKNLYMAHWFGSCILYEFGFKFADI
jgi:hypothetical protein